MGREVLEPGARRGKSVNVALEFEQFLFVFLFLLGFEGGLKTEFHLCFVVFDDYWWGCGDFGVLSFLYHPYSVV